MIELRPFTAQGFVRLKQWIGSERDLVQWAGPQLFRHPLDDQQLEAYLRLADGIQPSSRIYAGFDIRTGNVVGHCELGAINRPNSTASMCRILIDPAHRGEGICVPMVSKLLRIGFEEEGLRRIDLRVYAFNSSAIKCYERAGFRREGLLRSAQLVGDEVWDVVVMGILKDEWVSSGNSKEDK